MGSPWKEECESRRPFCLVFLNGGGDLGCCGLCHSYLLDDPVNLPVNPFLLVVLVNGDVFAGVAARVVFLAAKNAVAGAAAARRVHRALGSDLLNAVYDQAMANGELAVQWKVSLVNDLLW